MLRWSQDRDGVRFAVTDRRDGDSSGPYAGANLGDHVGDDPAAVAANRARLAAVVGAPAAGVLWLSQVHGADVVVLDGTWTPGGEPPRADAAATRRRDVALAVLVADCTPVLVADPVAGVVGVAHAGREGLVAGVVPALLAAMEGLGARPGALVARVGPSVCGRHYEVPADLADRVVAAVPQTRAVSERGTPALDVAAGVLAQLGPYCADLERLPGCTVEDPSLYSYRRDRTTGRSAAVVALLP